MNYLIGQIEELGTKLTDKSTVASGLFAFSAFLSIFQVHKED
jgi:hypothetical protein